MTDPCRPRQDEGYAARGDEGAPSEVEQKQLDELHIAIVPAENQ